MHKPTGEAASGHHSAGREPQLRRLLELSARLSAEGARDEALGEYLPATRVLGVLPRAPRIRPAGRVWRLGDYLLTPEGELRRTGRVVRVAGTDRRRSVVASSITERHELAIAAKRGGYRDGETVNFDTRPIHHDAAIPMGYLEERADLLLHPPGGD